MFRDGGDAHHNNVQLGRFGRNRTKLWNYPGANVFMRNGCKSDLRLHPNASTSDIETRIPVMLVLDFRCAATAWVISKLENIGTRRFHPRYRSRLTKIGRKSRRISHGAAAIEVIIHIARGQKATISTKT